MRLGLAAAFFLAGAAAAAPYSWSGRVAPAFRAPTDQIAAGRLHGAALQGGLVDIRYGQVSVDLGGVAEVLETDSHSILTLDGSPIKAEDLLKRVPEGLAVAVRFAPETGKIGWLDAYTRGAGAASVKLGMIPWKGPAYEAGETVTLTLSRQESDRLGGQTYQAIIPGVAHDLPFIPMQGGGLKAVLRVLPGWNYRELPVFLKVVGGKERTLRGPSLSLSTSAPEISGFGPHLASSALPSIPGWVDLRSESRLLDPTTAKLTVSPGARILHFQPRVDRTVFELETDGPGEYWLQFTVADKMGREVSKRWLLTVSAAR